MPSAKPSLDLLRSLTEEHVLRALMERERLTRAEIAAVTGISKPTISEAARRLEEAGLVVDTGERSTGRGRAGSYYTLGPQCGAALVAAIGPTSVVAEAVDPFGEVVASARRPLAAGAHTDMVTRALVRAVEEVRAGSPRPLHTAVVSAADPVDRQTGRLVHLPDTPFLVGDLDARAVLAPSVDGPVLVDNDVNWAARAEQADGAARGMGDFAYLYLGEGMGCAVVSDGQVRRGHDGYAGEIAHVVTRSPDGRAAPLVQVVASLGLHRTGSTAIDVDLLRSRLASDGDGHTAAGLAQAIAGVVMASIALVDPEVVVVGGPWGADPVFVAALRHEVAGLARQVPVVPAALTEAPELTAARTAALGALRDGIVALSRGSRD